MTRQSKAALQTYVDTNLTTNGQNGISGAELDTFLTNLLDSGANGDVVTLIADNTGNTDISSTLIALMEANLDKTIFFPPGTYLLALDSTGSNGTDFATSVRKIKWFAIPGTVTILTAVDKFALRLSINGQAGQPAEVAVSALALDGVIEGSGNADSRVTRLTVASAAGFAKGQWVHIHSTDVPLNQGASSDLMQNYGESAKVSAVSGNFLYLDRVLCLHSTYATGIKVRRYNPDAEVHLYGLKFSANVDPFASTSSSRQDTLDIRATVGVIIENCSFDSIWRAAIALRSCPGAIVRNVRIENLPNYSDRSAFGYGINLMGACANVLCDNVWIGRCRHGVTTGQNNISWEHFGFPTNCVFSNITVAGAFGNAFDMHAEGFGLIFNNITILNPIRGGDGAGGSSSGGGMYVRCGDVQINGYNQRGGSQGIVISARVGYTGRKIRHVIGDAVITDLFHSSSDAAAIKLEPEDDGVPVANQRELHINNLIIRGADVGIKCQGSNKVFLNSLHCIDVGVGIELAEDPTESIVIVGNATMDYKNIPAGTHYVAKFLSAGSCYINNLTIWKGIAAGHPAAVFHDAGSGTMKYRLGQLLEYNPSAVTQTAIVSGTVTKDLTTARVSNDG